MRYTVIVKPGSSQEKVIQETENVLVVYLHAKPHGGEANTALVNLLAKYFGVPKTTIKIVRGTKSKLKIVEV